jgi:hypothetical protein
MLRKNAAGREKCQGTTLQAAEKQGFVTGHDFSRAENAAK